MSPRSELAEHFGKHLEKTLPHHQPDISLPSQEVPQPSRQQQEILERGARRFTDLAQPLPDNPGVNR